MSKPRLPSLIGLAVTSFSAVAAAASAQAPSPPPFAGAASAAAQLDLSLDEAVAIAHQRSFRGSRARRNHEISELRYGIARAGYLPTVEVGGSVEQSVRGFQYESDRYLSFTQPIRGEFRGVAGASAVLPLDLFGVIKRQVRQADLARRISSQDVALAMLDVTHDAQQSYLSALRAQIGMEADERVAAELEALLKRSKIEAGSIAPFIEVELAAARQALTTSRAAADQAADGLKQVLRLPLEARLRLTTRASDKAEPLDQSELLERALAARPDVQQVSLRMEQARVYRQQVTDHRKPSLSLGGFYNQQLFARSIVASEPERFSARGFGLIASVPIARWDNGQLRRQKEIARVQQEQVAADAEELRDRVAYELRHALLAVKRAENRIQTLPERQPAYTAMKRAQEAMLRAPNGQGQALLAQVSNARQVWRSADTAAADAYIELGSAIFRLKRVLGEAYVTDGRAEGKQTAELPKKDRGLED